MRPGSVTAFAIVAWSAVGVLVLTLLINVIVISQYGSYAWSAGIVLGLLLTLLLAVGLAVTTALTMSKRSNVARWIFVGVAGLALLLTLIGMFIGRPSVIGILINILTLGTLIGSIVLAVLPGMSAWLGVARPAGGGYGGGYPPQPGYPPAPSQGSWGAPPPSAGYPPASGGYPPAAPTGFDAAPPATSFDAPAASGGTRACPYCAEQIRAEASKCRFCGSEVQPLA